MKTSSNGIALIKTFEGFRATPYKDVAGKLTIGFGHLILAGEVFGALSSVEATALLMKDVADKAEVYVNKFTTFPLTQNQFDALVSFTFNEGGENYRTSTLLKYVNSSQYEKVPAELCNWVFVHVNGKAVVNAGLLSRRQKEGELFSSPDSPS